MWPRRKALQFAPASEFVYFSAHERPRASIFHENFEISNSAPDLVHHKSFAKNFSGTPRPNHNHQHIPLNNLTGGYRKRLSGFRATSQNVTKIPENSVHHFFASRPRRLKYYLDGGYLNRLYKSCTITNNQGGAARH